MHSPQELSGVLSRKTARAVGEATTEEGAVTWVSFPSLTPQQVRMSALCPSPICEVQNANKVSKNLDVPHSLMRHHVISDIIFKHMPQGLDS